MFPIANLTVGCKANYSYILWQTLFIFDTRFVTRCVDHNEAVFSEADCIILTLQGVDNL